MSTTNCINFTTTTTTMATTGCSDIAGTSESDSATIQTFKELFLQLIGKDELYFFGIAAVGILVLLIIACCIGCKGCCCRACCGSRETKFSMNTCKLPGLSGGGGHGIQGGCPKEVAVVPITRCCYHPHHCSIDIERPFVCDCRRVCRTCTGYFPTSINARPHLDQDDRSESQSPQKVKTEQNGESTGPKPYHRVEVDTMPVHKPSNSGTKKAPTPNPKGTAPTAPAQDIGFNYSARLPPGAWSYTNPPCPNPPKTSQMGFVDPKKPVEVDKPGEQPKPEVEEEW